jgi:L-lactate dehydrogenase (cytochrome)
MARKISTNEISQHSCEDDIWIVVNGKVYDVTEFASEHPGGAESKEAIIFASVTKLD